MGVERTPVKQVGRMVSGGGEIVETGRETRSRSRSIKSNKGHGLGLELDGKAECKEDDIDIDSNNNLEICNVCTEPNSEVNKQKGAIPKIKSFVDKEVRNTEGAMARDMLGYVGIDKQCPIGSTLDLLA